MDYLTSTLGDFKHGFLQMLENNLLSGAAHEEPMEHLRKFIKLTNMVRQNCVLAKSIKLYAFLVSLNGRHGAGAYYLRTTSLHGTNAQVPS